MKILLTGATGYIGSCLLQKLVQNHHKIYALMRTPNLIRAEKKFHGQIQILQGNLLDFNSLQIIPEDIDAAYYLVHSMKDSAQKFSALEAQSALNFQQRISQTKAKQIIYLSGLSNEPHLSKHLSSRKQVDDILRKGNTAVTTLMAGIIIGTGSASFKIIQDLVEKLPLMIAPKWINSLTQPIAISDVLEYLILVLGHPNCLGQHFEIGGPDILSYKQLLLEFARIKGLKRYIITVPLLTPRLSSYWLYFITKVSLALASSLVDSLRNNAICKENRIQTLFPKKLLSFETAIHNALALQEKKE